MEFTKERFLKIQSWSETYGPGSNVVLPAEEAAELASIVLAAMDSEPVMYQARMWNPEYEEWEPWAECNENAFVVFSQEADRGEGMEVRKLYSVPQPLPVVDTEPYGFTDGDRRGMIYEPQYADRLKEALPVYRHAQPEPVVPEDVSGPLAHAYKELTPTFMRNHITVFERYGIAPNDSSTVIQALRIALDGIERRAAMLQPLHAIKAASALGSLPKTGEVLHTNSPVIPDGYVMVPKEPTESMINAWLSEVANWRGHVAGYKAMLAAAPQEEVKGE